MVDRPPIWVGAGTLECVAALSFEGGRYAVALEGGESVRVRPSNMSELLSGAFDDAAVTAAEGGDETALLAWLDGGGRANATYERGEASGLTLLMGAAVHGHERVVNLLLRRGAKVNLQNSDGFTALIDAAFKGHERVVDLLIRRGAEINLQDSGGYTALMLAAAHGHERVVELLLRRGAEFNLQNNKGGTALMLAAVSGYSGVVRRLLRAGADTAARSESGNTSVTL